MTTLKPYHERGGIALYHGRCEDVMATLPAGEFGAIVTDPPYGQTNESYDKGVSPEAWRECFRVAADGAALLSFAGSPTYHVVASGIEAAGWRVRQMWAWIYRDGFMTSAWPREGFDRLAPAMDPICYAAKGKCLLTLEREGDAEWDRLTGRKGGDAMNYSGRASSHGDRMGKGRWPRSVVATDGVDGLQYFALSRASVGSTSRTGHPNEKPLALMEWLVSKTPAGAVLDPFAGSGTTLIAALNAGRPAVGIEMNEAYCEIAARRIDALAESTPLLA